jgi:hypothetical protein
MDGLGRAGDKAPSPGILYQVDLEPCLGNRNTQAPGAGRGDMWQFYLVSPAFPKAKALQTLRVELHGESAALVGIVQIQVRRKDGKIDGSKMNISCFIKAVKTGRTAKESTSVLKITPVGQDGKDWPTAQFRLPVDRPESPAKKALPSEPLPDPLPLILPGR